MRGDRREPRYPFHNLTRWFVSCPCAKSASQNSVCSFAIYGVPAAKAFGAECIRIIGEVNGDRESVTGNR